MTPYLPARPFALSLMWLAFALLAAGCAPLQPHRTRAAATVATSSPAPCNPSPRDAARGDPGGDVAGDCKTLVREDADAYRLHFIEFDDQGWLFPAGPDAYGVANAQSTLFFDDLKARLAPADAKLSVVVFVHGWKHDAGGDDNNVRAFRQLLASVRQAELLTTCPREVAGLYVGWRGSGVGLGPLAENLSFYSRKSAAQKVAQGYVRVVFSKLRVQQDAANVAWNTAVQAQRADQRQRAAAPGGAARAVAPPTPQQQQVADDPCARRMRLTIAGHSFGGLIVYTALAQALIRDVVELRQAETDAAAGGEPALLEREGDLVVVINPAIEATRYDPLYRAAAEAPLPHYHAPLFVAVTSSDDQATRTFFPLGRALSTAWERYPDDVGAKAAEREANLNTFGQSDAYLSHHLAVLPAADPAAAGCAGWVGQALPERLRTEKALADAFEHRLAAAGRNANATGVFPRAFCSQDTLALRPFDGPAGRDMNSPLWNIRTARPVLDDHSDISNPRLIHLLRQLYMDADIAAVQRQQRQQQLLRERR